MSERPADTRATRGHGTLLWPIAGVFLVTALIGSALQWVLVATVLQPLETRDERARAELAASAAATALADVPTMPDPAAVESVLVRQRGTMGGRPAWLGFRSADSTIVTVPPHHEAMFRGDSGLAERGVRFAGPPPDTNRFEGGRRRRVEMLARRIVERNGVVRGEVAVARPAWSRGPGWPPFGGPPGPSGARTTLLILPLALLASLVAGFVTVRLLVRRLRALERLAGRVAEGDLSVRIADRSGDEIGRLAGGLDRMAERLAEARRELEEGDRQRRQLFADITHELATPLTSIRGYAETLVDPSVTVSDTERTRYVGGILEESRRLDRLIRDLFDLARLEAGAAPLQRERLDWTALCRHTVERFLPRFRAADIAVDCETPPAPAWIDADGRRIEQVLDNLLVNALRYVPSGGHVRLTLVPQRDHRYRLTVADDGPGIPDQELPLVFRRFYRAAATPGATHTGDGIGSGLGLAIVREIVERHGGAVHARSNAPRGLAIDIVLPAQT